MLDDNIELLLELLLDGMAEAVGAKRVPLPIRILLGAFLTLLVLALFGLFLYVGISSCSVVLIVLSAAAMVTAII